MTNPGDQNTRIRMHVNRTNDIGNDQTLHIPFIKRIFKQDMDGEELKFL